MKNVVRGATTGLLLSAVMLAVALTADPAAAQQPGPFRRAERPTGNAAEPRQALQRGEQPPPRQASAPGQMSPEERRQLRRDIDEHGRDLYKERRERR